MGRYKEQETTGIENVIPPFLYAFKIEDTKTGRVGKGAGYTKKEARDNAWKDLKFGEEPKYREKPKDRPVGLGVGGGGRGGGGSFSFPGIEDIVGYLTIGFLLLGGVFAGLEYLTDKVESGIIKKVWTTYETTAERDLRIKTEKKQEEERIFSSLDKFLDRWLKQNVPRAEKSQYRPYFYFDYAKIGEDIWVTGGATFTIDYMFQTKNFVFYSADSGTYWEVKWEKPREWLMVGLRKILVIDQQRVCIRLFISGIPSRTGMLYTVDRGESWEIIDGKWDPKKVKNL